MDLKFYKYDNYNGLGIKNPYLLTGPENRIEIVKTNRTFLVLTGVKKNFTVDLENFKVQFENRYNFLYTSSILNHLFRA